MPMKNLLYLIPESFEEYQNLPEKERERLANYALREAVIKVSKSVIASDDLKGSENDQEAFSASINQYTEDLPKQPFLISLGQSLMDKAEQFMDWLYDKYMKLAYKLHRREYE